MSKVELNYNLVFLLTLLSKYLYVYKQVTKLIANSRYWHSVVNRNQPMFHVEVYV